MDGFIQTSKIALRRLRRERGVTLLVVLSLSLGIGATTTIFGLVNAVLLRPLPGVGQPDELVSVTPRPVEIPGLLSGSFHVPLSYPVVRAYAEEADALAGLAAYQPMVVHAVLDDRVERLDGEIVSPNYFSVLRSAPSAGSFFLPLPDHPEGRPDAMVLSHDLWKSWGAAPGLVGATVRLNGAPFTVVGVAPEGFHGMRRNARPQVWVPIASASRVLPGMDATQIHDPERGWLFWFVARLRPGADASAAQERLDAVTEGLREGGASAEQAAGLVVRPGVGLRPDEQESAVEALTVLMAVMGFLLLVACLNAAILLLGRVPHRRKETSVRLALGATRSRVIRELLVESLLLSTGSAVGGILLSWLAVRLISRLDLAGLLPDVGQVVVDLRVLGFALGVGVLSALVFGLAPALRSSRVDLVSSLKGVASGRRHGERLQHLLVVAQVAVSVALLVATGLLVRSFVNHQQVPLGFQAESVLNVRFDLERQGYGEDEGRAFLARTLESVRSLLGVEAASLAAAVPLAREGDRAVAQTVPATGSLAGEAEAWITYNLVGPAYLETLRIPLVRGRDFTEGDGSGAPAIAVVNETLAATFWPGEDPLGQWMSVGGNEVRVVGVAADAKTAGLTSPAEPHFYRPVYQEYRPVTTLHVRSRLEAATLLAEVENRIRELDPHLPLFAKGLLTEQLDAVLARPRLAALFVGTSAMLGLLLSLVGIGGVLYRTAMARLQETGIRLSLGARRSDVLWLFLRRGLATAGLGMALGAAGALALSRTLSSFLYGVAPNDPAVFGVVLALIAGLALLANGVPAYLGTRADPAKILREE